jgi:ABC-type multidrug transport system ATPase subunit
MCFAPALVGYLQVTYSALPTQEDIILPQLTAWEVLALHAALSLPGVDGPTAEKRIDEVLRAMGLARQRDTLVGGSTVDGQIIQGT